MTTKGVFISFDYDHDSDLRGNLVAQARNPESPLSITDWSVQHRIDENWRREVRDRIRRADLTIVICGEHTHDAPGVAAEITIAREEGKPYFLLSTTVADLTGGVCNGIGGLWLGGAVSTATRTG